VAIPGDWMRIAPGSVSDEVMEEKEDDDDEKEERGEDDVDDEEEEERGDIIEGEKGA